MIGGISRNFKKSAKSIAKKEIKKDIFEQKVISALLLLTVISVSVLFLSLFSHVTLVGYATNQVDAEAGSVTDITIYKKFATSYWNGIYGLALRVPGFTESFHSDFYSGDIMRQDLFFDCIQNGAAGGTEVYASTSPVIDFNNLVAATPAQVDSAIGCTTERECAVNTFTDTMNVSVGENYISNVPSTFTHRWDGQNDIFDLGILYDGSNLVYVSHIGAIQKSYNFERIVNFQMLLPVLEDSFLHYYFFTDPNDECPSSESIGENLIGTVTGFVFDELGDPISNVSVTVAGVTAMSTVNGSYSLSFSSLSGSYNLFAEKTGYDNYFSNVTVNFSNYQVSKNITLSVVTPGVEEVIEVIVYGSVKDPAGTPLKDTRIILGDSVAITNTTGWYNITSYLTIGNHSIVAIKELYDNFHNTINFTTDGELILQDIVLDRTAQNYDFETGPYVDEPVVEGLTQEEIEEILSSGEDFWISSKEIKKEVRRNTFVEEEVGIYNLRKTNMDLTFTLSSNLKDFVKIDKTRLSILPDTHSSVKVTMYGTRPLGTYKGELVIAGTLDQVIPIEVKVVEKKFPVEVLLMEIDLFKNVVQPGDDLSYKLNLQNLLRDQSYQVKLTAKLKDLNGENVYLEEEFDAEVDNSLTLLKDLRIPENLTSGDFLLEIDAEYLNLISTVTSSFVVSKPVYLYSFFGIPIWLMFSIISFFSFVSLNVFMYKRYNDRKKRYKIQVEYNTLPDPGSRTVKLGLIAETRHPAYYEVDRLTTHAIVAGATGMGKSISAQVLIEECLMKGIAVLVFDPTAQWSGMLRKCTDKKMISYYPKFGLKGKDARAFKGNVRMIKDAKQKLDINKYVNPGEIQIFSMNKLTPQEIDVFVANTIKQIFRSDPKEAPELKVLMVFDEVHRLLPKFGGSGVGFLQIERATREFRKWGLGVMLISQVLNDFVGEIKANINTELQTRTLEENDLERIKVKYGDEFLKSLVRAEVGVIMFQNAEYNRGRPYFVNFRPILHSTRRLTDEELDKYNKFNDIVDELEFQVDALEKERVDIFDLKMELKLVKDKIMTGSFSVVEIYLEGLTPRVAKEWEKLGKTAPKLEIELVDDKVMASEEAKSKAEKEKAEAKEKIETVEKKVVDKDESEESRKEKKKK